MNISRWTTVLVLSIPLAFMAMFYVAPFFILGVSSFETTGHEFTLSNYEKLFNDAYYWEAMATTFQIAIWVTILTFILGYPLAYFMTFKVRNRLIKRLCYVVVITPLFTSNVVRAFGWIVLLGRNGLINDFLLWTSIVDDPISILFTEESIIIGLTYIMTPFMVLAVAAILQNIDLDLKTAARDLGAGRLACFLKVTFPLSLPGVIAGSLMVFTLCVSAYVTPSILSGGREVVMSMLIFQQYASVLNFNFGATLAIGLLVTAIVLITVYQTLISRMSNGRVQ